MDGVAHGYRGLFWILCWCLFAVRRTGKFSERLKNSTATVSWLLVCQDILQDVVNQRKFWSNLLSNTFSQTAEPQTGSLQEVSITLNLCQNWYEPIYPRVSYKKSTAPSFIFRILWRKEMRPYPIKAPFGWLPDYRGNTGGVGDELGMILFRSQGRQISFKTKGLVLAVLPGVHLCNMCILVAL